MGTEIQIDQKMEFWRFVVHQYDILNIHLYCTLSIG